MSDSRGRVPSWLIAGALIFLGWTLVGVLSSTRTFTSFHARGLETSMKHIFWPNMLSVWLWASFTPLVFQLCARWRLDSRSWQRAGTFHLAAGIAFAAADVLLDSLVEPFVLGFDRTPLLVKFGYELFINMFSYAGLVAVAHAISYYRMFRAQELHSVRLEAKLAEARIQALRSHLHPHFLFNTINAAAELVHEDSEAADRMLTRLGQLLQRAFSEAQLAQVPLHRELSFAQQYLDIAQIRFGTRLETAVHASPEAERAMVPSFVLQPLVENAIRHGVERASTAVRLEIGAAVARGELQITVSDSGPGLPADPSSLERRTGLLKVEGLLRALYPDSYQLSLKNRPGGGAIAEVRIPHSPAEDRDALWWESPALQASD